MTRAAHKTGERGRTAISPCFSPWPGFRRLPLWWSQALFPAESTYLGCYPRRGVLAHSLLLAVLASALFFSRLDCPLLEPEEARYAEIPRQMLAEQTFVTPVLHGEPYYQKPPLLYWLVMACYAVCGVDDWVARLVPGTAGVLVVLLTYWWGRRPLGTGAAVLGALILCLSARFVYLGRMLTTDSLLCLWVTAALLAGYRALATAERGQRWWLASAGACGLGLLTKGPVALALVAPPLLAFQLLDRRGPRFSGRSWLLYVSAAVGLAGPWFVAVALRDPRAAADFFWLHNVVRYTLPFDHAKPCWFYLPPLLTGMLPWTLLLVPLGRFLASRSPAVAARRPRALGFFLLAFLWGLAFYSAAGCKRAVYLLPLLPPLALALGCYLAAAVPWRIIGGAWAWLPLPVRRPALHLGGVAALFVLLLAAVCFLLPDYNRRFALGGLVRPLQGLAAEGPVFCCPRRWDSVSFYLRRDDVDACGSTELAPRLGRHPQALVFLKEDAVRELPLALEFTPCGPARNHVVAGVVRRRE